MSNADEMLSKLGYKKIIDNKTKIIYDKKDEYFDKRIVFKLADKTVQVGLDTYEIEDINMQELQAINEKVKELKWIQ